MCEYHNILSFWFSENTEPLWFAKNDAFDNDIKARFSSLLAQASNNELTEWEGSAKGTLALVILLDQCSRNIYRNTKEAFAYDKQALDLSKLSIKNGFDQQLSVKERVFFYLPFMHSESLEDQNKSVELFEALGLEINLKFAIEHQEIIKRFGRFPHRNAILGRISTQEEQFFLENEHGGF
ncbi:MAG: DUF924 domain-containing protein [Rickettsiales bacterium]|nr:DUF924 domain-containing protein [Rickettsiales bacterium]